MFVLGRFLLQSGFVQQYARLVRCDTKVQPAHYVQSGIPMKVLTSPDIDSKKLIDPNYGVVQHVVV